MQHGDTELVALARADNYLHAGTIEYLLRHGHWDEAFCTTLDFLDGEGRPWLPRFTDGHLSDLVASRPLLWWLRRPFARRRVLSRIKKVLQLAEGLAAADRLEDRGPMPTYVDDLPQLVHHLAMIFMRVQHTHKGGYFHNLMHRLLG